MCDQKKYKMLTGNERTCHLLQRRLDDVDGFLDNNGALGRSAVTHIRIWIC